MPSLSRPVMSFGDANVNADQLVQLIDEVNVGLDDPDYQLFEDLENDLDDDVCCVDT